MISLSLQWTTLYLWSTNQILWIFYMRWLSYLPAVHFTYLNLHILTYLNLSRSKKKIECAIPRSDSIAQERTSGKINQNKNVHFFIWCQFLVFAKTNCMSLFNFNITLSVRPYFCRLARHGTGDAKRFKLKPRSLQFAPEMHSFSTTMSTKNTLNEIFSKLFCIWRLRTESNLLCPKMQKDGMTSD